MFAHIVIKSKIFFKKWDPRLSEGCDRRTPFNNRQCFRLLLLIRWAFELQQHAKPKIYKILTRRQFGARGRNSKNWKRSNFKSLSRFNFQKVHRSFWGARSWACCERYRFSCIRLGFFKLFLRSWKISPSLTSAWFK